MSWFSGVFSSVVPDGRGPNEASYWENEAAGKAIKDAGYTLGNDKPAEINQSAWDYMKQGENNP